MKKPYNVVIVGLILFFSISCKSTELAQGVKNIGFEKDPDLESVLLAIKENITVSHISYNILGNPNNGTEKNPGSTIKIELHNAKLSKADKEIVGKEIAGKVLRASDKTKNYGFIWVSFVNEVDSKLFAFNSTKNIIFKSSEL